MWTQDDTPLHAAMITSFFDIGVRASTNAAFNFWIRTISAILTLFDAPRIRRVIWECWLDHMARCEAIGKWFVHCNRCLMRQWPVDNDDAFWTCFFCPILGKRIYPQAPCTAQIYENHLLIISNSNLKKSLSRIIAMIPELFDSSLLRPTNELLETSIYSVNINASKYRPRLLRSAWSCHYIGFSRTLSILSWN